MWWLTLFLASQAAVAHPGDACQNWQAGNPWPGNYQAHLVFTVDHEVHSWTIELTFDGEVEKLDCWQADWETDDNIHFTLTNLVWDGDIEEGEEVNILIQVHFDDDAANIPDMIYATFDGEPICGTDVPTQQAKPPQKQQRELQQQSCKLTVQKCSPWRQKVKETGTGSFHSQQPLIFKAGKWISLSQKMLII